MANRRQLADTTREFKRAADDSGGTISSKVRRATPAYWLPA